MTWSRVPMPYSRLIGRDHAVAEVVELLASRENRVVTLAGPGGIGKSRLAIEVADTAASRFPEGSVFVGLENILEPKLLPHQGSGRPSGRYCSRRSRTRSASGIPVRCRARNGWRLLRGTAFAGRARQLRAARPGRPRAGSAVRDRPGRRVPPHQPRRAADPWRTDLRGTAAGHPRPGLAHLADPRHEGSGRRVVVERARAVKLDFELTTTRGSPTPPRGCARSRRCMVTSTAPES